MIVDVDDEDVPNAVLSEKHSKAAVLVYFFGDGN